MATPKQIPDVILHLANKLLEYLNLEYLNTRQGAVGQARSVSDCLRSTGPVRGITAVKRGKTREKGRK